MTLMRVMLMRMTKNFKRFGTKPDSLMPGTVALASLMDEELRIIL